MSKVKFKIHWNEGTAEDEAFGNPDDVMRRVMATGFWGSPTKFYPPDRITYIELIKEDDGK